MTAFAIIRHALLMLRDNWRATLTISALPFSIIVLCQFLIASTFASFNRGDIEGGVVIGVTVIATFLVLAALWGAIAVTWHRMIILAEPASFIPAWRPSRWIRYSVGFVLVAFLGSVLWIPLGYIILKLGQAGLPAWIPAFAFLAMVVAVLLRISILLPALAVHHSLTIAEAWKATSGLRSSKIVIGVVVTTVSMVTTNLSELIEIAFAAQSGLLAIAIDTALKWITALLGLSLMTTLYGHAVEHRSLR